MVERSKVAYDSRDVAVRGFSWEIKRELSPGYFRTYAHGYWRHPFVVVVLGRVLIGKRALAKRWAAAEGVRP